MEDKTKVLYGTSSACATSPKYDYCFGEDRHCSLYDSMQQCPLKPSCEDDCNNCFKMEYFFTVEKEGEIVFKAPATKLCNRLSGFEKEVPYPIEKLFIVGLIMFAEYQQKSSSDEYDRPNE